MTTVETLHTKVTERFAAMLERAVVACGELTIEIPAQHLLEVCTLLRDEPAFGFNCLLDVCGVDYLHYGLGEWETESSTATGFERGVDREQMNNPPPTKHRFASVYHLLSLTNNHRLRIRVFLPEEALEVPSVCSIWPSANWFEREAFDLFGIVYRNHPDLRRILTDYGFIGHPFRKDFPLIGKVEARYDAKLGRVVYDPVSIEPRVLEPKVIRRDSRYEMGE